MEGQTHPRESNASCSRITPQAHRLDEKGQDVEVAIAVPIPQLTCPYKNTLHTITHTHLMGDLRNVQQSYEDTILSLVFEYDNDDGLRISEQTLRGYADMMKEMAEMIQVSVLFIMWCAALFCMFGIQVFRHKPVAADCQIAQPLKVVAVHHADP